MLVTMKHTGLSITAPHRTGPSPSTRMPEESVLALHKKLKLEQKRIAEMEAASSQRIAAKERAAEKVLEGKIEVVEQELAKYQAEAAQRFEEQERKAKEDLVRRLAEEEEKKRKELEAATPAPMDGVFEYLPTQTMTKEERARNRVPKRKSVPAAGPPAPKATPKGDDKPELAQVRIEQDDPVLMHGQDGIWNVDHKPSLEFDEEEEEDDESPEPEPKMAGPYMDEDDEL